MDMINAVILIEDLMVSGGSIRIGFSEVELRLNSCLHFVFVMFNLGLLKPYYLVYLRLCHTWFNGGLNET